MKRKLLGFGSIFCPVYVLLMSITLIVLSLSVNLEQDIPSSILPVVIVAAILLFLSVIGIWFFIIYDIIHAATNPDFSGRAKAGWICALWFLNILVIPVYWIKYLRKDHRVTNSIVHPDNAPADAR